MPKDKISEYSLLTILPKIYHIEEPMNYHQMCKFLNIIPCKMNYGKIKELIDVGLMRSVDSDNGSYLVIPNRDAIWRFWSGTPTGKDILRMKRNSSLPQEIQKEKRISLIRKLLKGLKELPRDLAEELELLEEED